MESKGDGRGRPFSGAKSKDVSEGVDVALGRLRLGAKDEARLSAKVAAGEDDARGSLTPLAAEAKPEPKTIAGSKQHKVAGSSGGEIDISDEKVEAEFEALLHQPNEPGLPYVSTNPIAEKVVTGLKISKMNMRDGQAGVVVWESSNWGDDMFVKELEEFIPKEILRCRVVSREIVFVSMEQLDNFRIEQKVFFRGQCIEEWKFTFGYVMAGSTNSWQQTIEAAPPEEMISPELLSGNVVFETSFFDDKLFICKNLVRIYYV